MINGSKLESLVFYYSGPCSYNCIHCSIEGGDSGSLDSKIVKETIDKVKTLKSVCFTGGNSIFSRSRFNDLIDIIKQCSTRGIGTNIETEGYILDKDKIDLLKESGLSSITFSLETINEDKYYEIARINSNIAKQRGTFNKIIESIKYSANNIPTIVTTVLMSVNKDEIPRIYEFVSNNNIDTFELQNLIPIGHASKRPDLFCNPEEIRDTLKRLFSVKNDRTKINVWCSPLSKQEYRDVHNERDLNNYRACPCGTSSLLIYNDGNIYSCFIFGRDKKFSLGNIYQDNILDVWNNATQLKQIRETREKDRENSHVCVSIPYLASDGKNLDTKETARIYSTLKNV